LSGKFVPFFSLRAPCPEYRNASRREEQENLEERGISGPQKRSRPARNGVTCLLSRCLASERKQGYMHAPQRRTIGDQIQPPLVTRCWDRELYLHAMHADRRYTRFAYDASSLFRGDGSVRNNNAKEAQRRCDPHYKPA
jgi:hypothetical protein